MSDNVVLETIVAVIVTHNRLELLRECLAAVRAQSRPVSHAVVVDNASTDGTRDFLNQYKWRELRIVRLPENIGGAGGFARGLSEAIKRGADLAWLMDDDCIPAPDALARLIEARQVMLARGVAHSFLCSRAVDNRGIACNHPVPSTARNASGWPRWADVADTGCVLVDECTFVSVAVSLEVARKVGLPIQKMFIWGDDVEYTRRLAGAAPGVFVGTSRVVHKRQIAGELNIFTEENASRVSLYRYHYRNRIYLYRNHFETSRYILYLAQVVNDLVMLLAVLRLRRAWIVARGLWEGLTFQPEIERV